MGDKHVLLFFTPRACYYSMVFFFHQYPFEEENILTEKDIISLMSYELKWIISALC